MKRFAPPRNLARTLTTAIILATTLGTSPDALGIHCIESILPVGKPSLIPMVTEVDPREIPAVLAQKPVLISKKPRIEVHPDSTVELMGGQQPEHLMVVAYEGAQAPLRPDWREVRGFIRYPEDALPRTKPTSPNKMYAPKSKTFFYGNLGKPMRQVTLETNEKVVTHAAIQPDRQLAVTVRTDQKIGFLRPDEKAKRSFMIELYQLEPNGHSVIAFSINAREIQDPKVQLLFAAEAKKLYLQVEDQLFEVALLPPSAFGG